MNGSPISEEHRSLEDIPMVLILNYLGYGPVIENERYAMYYAPWRNERTPSLKVDVETNLFIDFGDRTFAGTSVTLVMHLAGIDRLSAMEWISQVFVDHVDRNLELRFLPREHLSRPRTIITDIRPVRGVKLLKIIDKYNFDREFVCQVCREVSYMNTSTETTGYGLGLENINKGHTLIGGGGVVGANGYSFIPGVFQARCLVFLSPLDYLAYGSMYGAPTEDVLLLNSDVFIKQVKELLSAYELVTYYLRENARSVETEYMIRAAAKVAVDGSGLHKSKGFETLRDYCQAMRK